MNLNQIEPCIYSKPFIARMHELNEIATKYNSDLVNIDYIKKGLAFAKHYHAGQMRKSGEPYVSHPIAVATMVANEKFKEDVIIAALLHDTVEDTELTLDEIEREFSPRIAEMVGRLTRIRGGLKVSVEEIVYEMLLLNDTESILIKIFDRYHNMQTIDALSGKKQSEILRETIKDIILSSFYLENPDLEYLLAKTAQSKLFNHKKQNDLVSSSYREPALETYNL